MNLLDRPRSCKSLHAPGKSLCPSLPKSSTCNMSRCAQHCTWPSNPHGRHVFCTVRWIVLCRVAFLQRTCSHPSFCSQVGRVGLAVRAGDRGKGRLKGRFVRMLLGDDSSSSSRWAWRMYVTIQAYSPINHSFASWRTIYRSRVLGPWLELNPDISLLNCLSAIPTSLLISSHTKQPYTSCNLSIIAHVIDQHYFDSPVLHQRNHSQLRYRKRQNDQHGVNGL